MRSERVKVSICSDEEESWNTIWKWSWFAIDLWQADYWEETLPGMQDLFSLLPRLQIKSILDCSCGLGFKSVLFAKAGYEVEGSDASAVAIEYAPQFAEKEGVKIRFFWSRFADLPQRCERRYDCVFSDYFDELDTRASLIAAAQGIFSVLNEGGRFIFCGPPRQWLKSDLEKLITQEWKKRERFAVLPPYEKGGIRVISLEVDEMTSEGILDNRIFLIEEHGVLRAEIASIMSPRIKWTFQDFDEILKEAGFRDVDSLTEGGTTYIMGIR